MTLWILIAIAAWVMASAPIAVVIGRALAPAGASRVALSVLAPVDLTNRLDGVLAPGDAAA